MGVEQTALSVPPPGPLCHLQVVCATPKSSVPPPGPLCLPQVLCASPIPELLLVSDRCRRMTGAGATLAGRPRTAVERSLAAGCAVAATSRLWVTTTVATRTRAPGLRHAVRSSPRGKHSTAPSAWTTVPMPSEAFLTTYLLIIISFSSV